MGKNSGKKASKNKKKGSAGKILATVILLAAAVIVIAVSFRLGQESRLGLNGLFGGTDSAAASQTQTESSVSEEPVAEASSSDTATESVSEESASSSASPAAEPTPTIDPRLTASATEDSFWEGCPARKIELLTPNEYSRPQLKMTTVNRVVIHYTANPGTTAEQNREYFENLAILQDRHASAHFIVDLDGTIVQIIPISEVAYAQVHANEDSISIECCHPDESGQFNDSTFYSASDLAAFFCKAFDLDPATQVVRHYDVTGKNCPKYYVENESAWTAFLDAVQARYDYITSDEYPES